MKVEYQWSPDTGTAICTLSHNSHNYVGTARCHSDDLDMKSERTGLFIAECRAYIKYYRAKRDNELKPQFNILQHTYFTLLGATGTNPQSKEMKVLRKQLQAARRKLDAIQYQLNAEKSQLKFYIDQKEKLYQRIRNQANK
jgi:hypothetical protein